jgi:NAD(P)-dependent dehydrogenase (short-subunit alcohol dehydrogenase family)
MGLDSTDVAFGAGGAGGAVVAELLRRGGRVRAVSRRGHAPEGAEGVAADAADSAEAAATSLAPSTTASPFPARGRSVKTSRKATGWRTRLAYAGGSDAAPYGFVP